MESHPPAPADPGLDDPVDDLLPELADMTVLADPNGPLDDTVAAKDSTTYASMKALSASISQTARPSHAWWPPSPRFQALAQEDAGVERRRPHGRSLVPPLLRVAYLASRTAGRIDGSEFRYSSGRPALAR
jgi:hypothetical protein